MTVLTYGTLGIVAAVVLSLCLFIFSRRKVRADGRSRNLVVASTAAPFLGLGWLVAALLIHVQISNKLAHQDCGLSGDPYVTLPNGYVLGSHNTYDGYFRAPGFETDVPMAGPGYVRSIIDLQLKGDYFVGTQFDFKTSAVRPFVFDTRTREFHVVATDNLADATNSSDLDRWAAAETSAHNDSDSYWVMYAQYRKHWPNYVMFSLIVVGEAGIVLGLWRLWRRPRALIP